MKNTINESIKNESLTFQNETLPEALPSIIPLITLNGAVVLPNSHLPVPMSSSDYEFVLRPMINEYGFVGIVQTIDFSDSEIEIDSPIFNVGCLVRLKEHKDVGHDQILCVFDGICRFEVLKEINESGIKKALIKYDRYKIDLDHQEPDIESREKLMYFAQKYLNCKGVPLNISDLISTEDQRFLSAVAMICPLKRFERQAILEMPDVKSQSRTLTKLIEIGMHENSCSESNFFH